MVADVQRVEESRIGSPGLVEKTDPLQGIQVIEPDGLSTKRDQSLPGKLREDANGIAGIHIGKRCKIHTPQLEPQFRARLMPIKKIKDVQQDECHSATHVLAPQMCLPLNGYFVDRGNIPRKLNRESSVIGHCFENNILWNEAYGYLVKGNA